MAVFLGVVSAVADGEPVADREPDEIDRDPDLGYGVILWAPTLFVILLGVSPAEASYLFIFVSLAGFVGRFVFSGFSELIGRRASGALQGFGAAVMVVAAGLLHDSFIGTVSVFCY
jgi:putative MFS transporter